MSASPVTAKKVIDWLLEENQPSIRYRALTELLGRPESDSEVREARSRIPQVGWAAEILKDRDPAGWWVSEKSHYGPKYISTNWKMLVLSDLGLTREMPAIRDSCEKWARMRPLGRGSPGSSLPGPLHHCMTGNAARAWIRFGYADDPRVRRALEWLVKTSHPKGGWSCFSSAKRPATSRTLDSWEGLSAFAAYPRNQWTRSMKDCVEKAAEFYLDRELHQQGKRYPPWFRFHYPIHYYYDLLVGLDLLTSLGYGKDPRLRYALSVLEEKRRADGRWNLDAVHPDVKGSSLAARWEAWFKAHPKDRFIPFALEKPGAPSKMITLRALLVLDRVGA